MWKMATPWTPIVMHLSLLVTLKRRNHLRFVDEERGRPHHQQKRQDQNFHLLLLIECVLFFFNHSTQYFLVSEDKRHYPDVLTKGNLSFKKCMYLHVTHTSSRIQNLSFASESSLTSLTINPQPSSRQDHFSDHRC